MGRPAAPSSPSAPSSAPPTASVAPARGGDSAAATHSESWLGTPKRPLPRPLQAKRRAARGSAPSAARPRSRRYRWSWRSRSCCAVARSRTRRVNGVPGWTAWPMMRPPSGVCPRRGLASHSRAPRGPASPPSKVTGLGLIPQSRACPMSACSRALALSNAPCTAEMAGSPSSVSMQLARQAVMVRGSPTGAQPWATTVCRSRSPPRPSTTAEPGASTVRPRAREGTCAGGADRPPATAPP
mmetsp:Transcript_3222/g.10671  ORF Transcript_3222/g.10671 Transcript_3222/m.10671 type:complete len:241 (+) Transcript_3222:412-1134(+)